MIEYRVSRGTLRGVGLFTAALLLAGCLDPESTDRRGYTKAPTEHAGWIVTGEQQTAMNKLGTPTQTVAETIDMPEEAPAETGPAKPAVLAPGATEAMVEDGRKLFAANTCVGCHGGNGAGTPIAPNLADKTWININGDFDQLVTVITNGVAQPKEFPAPMPPKGGAAITDDQVRAIAAYIYSISH